MPEPSPPSTLPSPAALVAEARDRTGLWDLGPDGWQPGLDRLVEAVGVDIGPDPAAVAVIHRTVLSRLENRLRIEEWYAAHGEQAGHRVEGPVAVIGLPRTATTALQHVLALDPRFRYQRRWELSDPVPPPDAATEHDDPRRLAATSTASAQHIATADGPVEDGPALALDFGHQELGFPLPTYTRWWRGADLSTTYRYHERVLQMLHARRPPHLWLLKAPSYCFHLTHMAARYPDARFVWTHRDPAEAIASACSVIRTAQENVVPTHRRDPAELGAFVLEHFAAGMRAATAAREALGEDRFLDVRHTRFEADPVETVERVLEFAGLAPTAAGRRATRDWAVANRRGARGEHRYASEEFGLAEQDIRAELADYVDRYDPAG